jgi:hypothetical protein
MIGVVMAGTDDRLLALSVQSSEQHMRAAATVNVFEWLLRQGARPTRKYVIQLPDGWQLKDAAFSPDRNRIAWLVEDNESSRGAHARSVFHLWISHIDGTHAHELGSAPSPPESKGAQLYHSFHGEWSRPNRIVWLPSGKGIAFNYEDAIWLVSVK